MCNILHKSTFNTSSTLTRYSFTDLLIIFSSQNKIWQNVRTSSRVLNLLWNQREKLKNNVTTTLQQCYTERFWKISQMIDQLWRRLFDWFDWLTDESLTCESVKRKWLMGTSCFIVVFVVCFYLVLVKDENMFRTSIM